MTPTTWRARSRSTFDAVAPRTPWSVLQLLAVGLRSSRCQTSKLAHITKDRNNRELIPVHGLRVASGEGMCAVKNEEVTTV